MKVISEHIIKKLIQKKLLENYKKKILTETLDVNSTAVDNQIISSGIIEAVYLFLTENQYQNEAAPFANLKEQILNRLNQILNSNSNREFKNHINSLITFLGTQLITNPDLSKNPLFTKLIANDQIIIQRFNDKLGQIKDETAYTIKNDDVAIIFNHTTSLGIFDKAKYLFIKSNINEIIQELLNGEEGDINRDNLFIKIQNLLPVIKNQQQPIQKIQNQNNSQTANNQIKQQALSTFRDLKNYLTIDNTQAAKLTKTVTQIAEKRTSDHTKRAQYIKILTHLAIRANNSDTNIVAAAQNQNPALATDAEATIKAEILAVQNSFDKATILFQKDEDPKYFSNNITNQTTKNNLKKLNQTDKNKKFRDLTYAILTHVILDKSVNDYPNISVDISNRDKWQKQLTLQINQILVGNELVKLDQEIRDAIKNWFEKINITAQDIWDIKFDNNFVILKDWIKEYFHNQKIYGLSVTVDYNFIKFIQLSLLNLLMPDNDTFKEELEKIKTTNIEETAEGATTTTTDATSTNKKCVRENDGHTDNFKLYPARSITGVSSADDYRLKIAEYLLDHSTTPANYGFINKNEDAKKDVSEKLKNASLDESKIAAALLKLYPNSEKQRQDEYWFENYYININADEIIAAATTP